MSVPATYLKTPKGNEEIQTRKNKLSVRQRNLLIMVDGSKPLHVLSEIATKLGLSTDDLAQLEKSGFIALIAQVQAAGTDVSGPINAAAEQPDATVIGPDEAAKFRTAHKFMNDTVVNSLGLKAFFFALKLERCATRADLAGLLGDFLKVLTKAMGATEADVMTKHARELIQH